MKSVVVVYWNICGNLHPWEPKLHKFDDFVRHTKLSEITFSEFCLTELVVRHCDDTVTKTRD